MGRGELRLGHALCTCKVIHYSISSDSTIVQILAGSLCTISSQALYRTEALAKLMWSLSYSEK